jgi:radical SAM protein with 4Fe4S-binding SPASM domain
MKPPEKAEEALARSGAAEGRVLAVPPLRILFWETTSACNLACVHCRRLDVGADQAGGESPSELSTSRAIDLVEQLAAFSPKPLLVLSGGEPLLRPDIHTVARHATQRGLAVALATNGTLVGSEVAAQIAADGIRRVSVSLDGADAQTHDAFRGVHGSFAAALAGIAALRAAGVPVQLNTTVSRHNLGQLDRLLALSRELGAVALHLFLLVPVGCGMQIADEEQISAGEYERVLHWLVEAQGRARDLQLRATCAPHLHRVQAQMGSSGAAAAPGAGRGVARGGAGGASAMHTSTRGCLAGTGVCFVSHAGQVFGCGYLPVEAGNLARQTLVEIWQTSPLFAELRDFDLLRGKCHGCDYVQVCGGCRARAYGMTGDYLGEEPLCAYRGGL